MKDKIKITVSECSWEEQPEEDLNYETAEYEETGNNVTKYDIKCTVEINGKGIKQYTDLFAFLHEFVNKSVVSNYADWYGKATKILE